jgi:hypothetical protein
VTCEAEIKVSPYKLTKSSQSITQSFDNWLNNTYLKANAKPTLTLAQARTANVNML